MSRYTPIEKSAFLAWGLGTGSYVAYTSVGKMLPLASPLLPIPVTVSVLTLLICIDRYIYRYF